MTQVLAPPRTEIPIQPPVSAQPELYRLSINQYEAMIASGIITEDDAVEFIDGWMIKKMGKNQARILTSELLLQILQPLLPAGWFLSSENALLIENSLPEPDLRVTRGKSRDYRDRRVTPDQVGLIVEISDSTLIADRTEKLALYAHGGIPTYWIINLPDRRIEAYSQPEVQNGVGVYKTVTHFAPDATIPFVLDGIEIAAIAVADLLP